MEAEKIDHIHFKTNDMERDTRIIEGLIGRKLPIEADLTTLYGMRIAFHPAPLGFELMEVTDKDQEIGRMYSEAPEGIFAISLKVPDIDKAIGEMESMGYKLILRYDTGPIKEAIFDTKKALKLYIELIEYPGESILDIAEEASTAGADSASIDKTG